MNFCPNCGIKLTVEGTKFCPECGANLRTGIPAVPASVMLSSSEQKATTAFELLKAELSSKASVFAKDIANSVIGKWKTSGKFPKRFGKVLDALVERALPPLVEMKIRGMPWKNEAASEISEGKLETSVSSSFPLELQTGIPLLGKITLKEVRLTIRGLVDVESRNVSQLTVGGVDLA